MSRAVQPLTCTECGMTSPPAQETCTAFEPPTDHRVGTGAGCRWCGRLKEACRRMPCTRRGVTWRFRLSMKVKVWRARRLTEGLPDRAAPLPPGCRASGGPYQNSRRGQRGALPRGTPLPGECPGWAGTGPERTVPGVPGGDGPPLHTSPGGPPPARSPWLSPGAATWARMMTAPGL